MSELRGNRADKEREWDLKEALIIKIEADNKELNQKIIDQPKATFIDKQTE